MAVQLNETASKLCQEVETNQFTQLINHHEVDVMSFTKHGINMSRFKPSETFDSFFDTESEIHSFTGYNSFKNPMSQHQRGGMGVLATDEVILYHRSGGIGFHNLEQCSSIILNESESHGTRMVSTYCLGKSKTCDTGRVYQHHLCYLPLASWPQQDYHPLQYILQWSHIETSGLA